MPFHKVLLVAQMDMNCFIDPHTSKYLNYIRTYINIFLAVVRASMSKVYSLYELHYNSKCHAIMKYACKADTIY
jgi:hypothetical protein